MRDLYSAQKLAYWTKRLYTDLQEPDRSDVLKIVQHIQGNDRSILWIVRCITALIKMRRDLEKNFNYCGGSTEKYCIVCLKYGCAEPLRAHYTGQNHHVDPDK